MFENLRLEDVVSNGPVSEFVYAKINSEPENFDFNHLLIEISDTVLHLMQKSPVFEDSLDVNLLKAFEDEQIIQFIDLVISRIQLAVKDISTLFWEAYAFDRNRRV